MASLSGDAIREGNTQRTSLVDYYLFNEASESSLHAEEDDGLGNVLLIKKYAAQLAESQYRSSSLQIPRCDYLNFQGDPRQLYNS